MRLYSRVKDRETVLELWRSSTKHPDSIFYFSKFTLPDGWDPEDKSNPIFIYQWLIECASKLTWWFYTRELVNEANELLENYENYLKKS